MIEAFHRKAVLGIVVILSLSACQRAATPTQGVDVASSEPVLEPSETPLHLLPEPTITAEPPSSQIASVLSNDELPVRIDFREADNNVYNSAVLLLSSEAHLSADQEVSLDYVLFNGEQKRVFSFDLMESGAIQAQLRTGTSDQLLISFTPSDYSEQYFIILDPLSGSVRGFKDECEVTYPISIGPEYIVFSCIENHQAWNFISVSDPETQFSFELPDDMMPLGPFEPQWLDENRIFFLESYSRAACIADITDWDPVCKDLDFWLGPISPDRKWFEVRIDTDNHPDQIGVIPFDCLLDTTQFCTTSFEAQIMDIALRGSDRYMKDSVWLPDSNGMLHIVSYGTDQTTLRALHSEIWRYDLASQSFEFLYEFPGEMYFGEPRFELAPVSWSPDGKSVIVKDGPRISKLNIETGELTLLTEGGVLLGSLTLPSR